MKRRYLLFRRGGSARTPVGDQTGSDKCRRVSNRSAVKLTRHLTACYRPGFRLNFEHGCEQDGRFYIWRCPRLRALIDSSFCRCAGPFGVGSVGWVMTQRSDLFSVMAAMGFNPACGDRVGSAATSPTERPRIRKSATPKILAPEVCVYVKEIVTLSGISAAASRRWRAFLRLRWVIRSFRPVACSARSREHGADHVAAERAVGEGPQRGRPHRRFTPRCWAKRAITSLSTRAWPGISFRRRSRCSYRNFGGPAGRRRARVFRVPQREGIIRWTHAVENNRSRTQLETTRFRALYGIELRDYRNYDLIVDTSYVAPETVAATIEQAFLCAQSSGRQSCAGVDVPAAAGGDGG